jgi:uncharacterized repeat protein (TIGR02543 family)
LTVNSGSFSASNVAGATMTLIADPAPAGQVFDKWESDNGGAFADANSPETTFTMPANNVTVTATYRLITYPYPAPAAAIDYVNETLTGLVSGAAYTFNGGASVTVSGTTRPLNESWIGSSLSIVRKGDSSTTVDSAAQSLAIPARPIAPNVSAANETVSGQNDGAITGVTTAMEYREATNGSWADVTGAQITGLAPGRYEVRVKATAGSGFAGATSTVTIAAGSQTYTLTVINGAASAASGPYTAGTLVSITANTAPAGQVFAGWTSSNGGIFASASSASTTFTMPAGNVTLTATYRTVASQVDNNTDSNESSTTSGRNTASNSGSAGTNAANTAGAANTAATGANNTADAAADASDTLDNAAEETTGEDEPATDVVTGTGDTEPASDIGDQETPLASGDDVNANANSEEGGSPALWIALVSALAAAMIAGGAAILIRGRRLRRGMK